MQYFLDTRDKTKGCIPPGALSEKEFFAQFDAVEAASHVFGVGAPAAHVNLQQGKAFCFISFT